MDESKNTMNKDELLNLFNEIEDALSERHHSTYHPDMTNTSAETAIEAFESVSKSRSLTETEKMVEDTLKTFFTINPDLSMTESLDIAYDMLSKRPDCDSKDIKNVCDSVKVWAEEQVVSKEINTLEDNLDAIVNELGEYGEMLKSLNQELSQKQSFSYTPDITDTPAETAIKAVKSEKNPLSEKDEARYRKHLASLGLDLDKCRETNNKLGDCLVSLASANPDFTALEALSMAVAQLIQDGADPKYVEHACETIELWIQEEVTNEEINALKSKINSVEKELVSEETIAPPLLNEHAGANGRESTEKFMAQPYSQDMKPVEFSYTETEAGSAHCFLDKDESGQNYVYCTDTAGQLLHDKIPVNTVDEALSYSKDIREQFVQYTNQQDYTYEFKPNIEDMVQEVSSAKDCIAATVVYKDGPVTETVYVETPVVVADDRGGTVSQKAAEEVYRPDSKPEVMVINPHIADNVTHIEDNAFQKFDTIKGVSVLGNVESLGKNSMPPNVEKVLIEETCPIAANKDTLLEALKEAGVNEKAEVALCRRDGTELSEPNIIRSVYQVSQIREGVKDTQPSKSADTLSLD